MLEEDSVGSFSCNIDDYNGKSLIDVLKTGEPEYIKFDYDLRGDPVELKNKNILVASSDDALLALYDSEFKLIRKITEINDKKDIFSTGLACDQNGNVFVANGFDSHYKLDSELNLIKLTTCSYCDVFDISIHENKIYMCGDKFLRVYSLDLDRISTKENKNINLEGQLKMSNGSHGPYGFISYHCLKLSSNTI